MSIMGENESIIDLCLQMDIGTTTKCNMVNKMSIVFLSTTTSCGTADNALSETENIHHLVK